MSSIDAANAPAADGSPGEQDLGPLAWVLDELRKSLDGAVKAMRRFVRDTDASRDSDLASLDVGVLRIARQQLHQASGALEMVGMAPSALVLRSMEAAALKYVQRPDLCNGEAVTVMERASFALIEYLENVLAGKLVSPVSLFPQYRDVQALNGADRVHPADLWPAERRFREPDLDVTAAALPYGAEARARLDFAVLRIVKNGDPAAALGMRDICLGFVANQSDKQVRAFWKICAGFFEAFGLGLLTTDIYVKRVASRVLLQYASLTKGDSAISDRLVQDLLFFCSQARPFEAAHAPALEAVRQAFGLVRHQAVDYETPRFGLHDPAVLAQARKRIAAATETWSALAGGDRNKLKPAADQFSLVCDSLNKLHKGNQVMVQALTRAMDATIRSGEPPSAALAMEVATSVLYLQASLEELDPSHEQMASRAARLAERLEHVTAGGESGPLEPWMEDLYRRVSDHQTMGSVVGELRATLAEAEKVMDQFFRQPEDAAVLTPVPGRLAQMRGVLSVLGLDQASLAVMRMRDTIERLLVKQVPESERKQVFDKLGNSLGALGFLIDMLSYQRAMARKLFVYDEELGELRILMGRSRSGAGDAPGDVNTISEERGAVVAPDFADEVSVPAPPAVISSVTASDIPFDLELPDTAEETEPVPALPLLDFPPIPAPHASASAGQGPENEEDELLDIFLEEAREVVANGLAAVHALRAQPGELSEQTTLRRAFHTLKGSSRMVGLNAFGEAAWAMEQALNAWLAEQKPMQLPLLDLSDDALHAFGRWVGDIAAGDASRWGAEPFRISADAMRADGTLVPLAVPGGARRPEAEDSKLPAIDLALPDDSSVPPIGLAAVALLDPQAPAVDAAALADVSEGIDCAAPAVALAEPAHEAPSSEAPVPEHPSLANSQTDVELPSLDLETAESHSDPQPAAAEETVVDGGDVANAAPEAAGMVSAAELPISAPLDEAIKVIDTLRIGIPLYNVYLNEADEWSRRLATLLQEWSLELHVPLPDSAIALAHSLAGSSATVGFTALSEMARTLEHALQHVQLQPRGISAQASVFMAAAEDIRRLLHQFAAGFLKEPNAFVLQQLNEILQTEVGSSVSAQEPGLDDVGSSAEDVAVLDASDGPEVPHGHVVPAQQSVMAEPGDSERAGFGGGGAVSERHDIDDDIDAADIIDPDLFPIFEEEAVELLPSLGAALRQWVARPDNRGARSELLRALHTLKGSSRLAGAMRLGEMAHRLESAVEQVDMEAAQTEDIEPLLSSLDALQTSFDTLRAIGAQPLVEPVAVAVAVAPASAFSVPSPDARGGGTALHPVAPMPPRAPVVTPLAPQRMAANQSVRVRAQLLDRFVNQTGEVMIARSRLDARMGQMKASLSDLTGNLDRLRHHLRDIEVQAESQMQSRMALSKDSAAGFDPLEFDRFTRVQELTRMMAESVNDVATVQRNLQRAMEGAEDDLIAQGRQARELQRDLLRTRMVEFDGISERLYAVVRQASKETGKQIRLDITGGSIEMDRGVLDRMTPAFEHLLRNCAAHGIEESRVRLAAGKPASGTITVALRQEGNDVSVEFRDDGGGLDLARIRAKAVAQGFVAEGADISSADAADLIFLPGFSTAAEVTGLSGRGIGMDVVRSEVQALGGRIETASEVGRGASFRMVLPLTTAVTQVVMLRAGSQSIGVPASLIEIVRRTTTAALEECYRTGQFEDGVDNLPFHWAGALLQSSRCSTEAAGKTRPVVILRSASQRLAMHVDEVLGNQEVVVKNLGPQLSRLPGLTGMSVLASGAVVLIYNPVALATVYGEQIRSMAAAAPLPAAAVAASHEEGVTGPAEPAGAVSQVPLVLVVDDSITVRRVTQRLLLREGYRVALAADGLQALERLQEERPTVVLSDIEMPRMDGFDLARNIRSDAGLRDLPIIMITSRIAQKHREHAMELGVNHYLGKPYSDEELLGLIRDYARIAAADAREL